MVGVGIGKYPPEHQNIFEKHYSLNTASPGQKFKFHIHQVGCGSASHLLPRASLYHKLHGPKHRHPERPDRTGVPSIRKVSPFLFISYCSIDMVTVRLVTEKILAKKVLRMIWKEDFLPNDPTILLQVVPFCSLVPLRNLQSNI